MSLAAQRAVGAEPDRAPVPRRAAWVAVVVAAIVIPLAALSLYSRLGSPEAIEQSQAFASLEGPLTPERLPAFRAQLASHLAGNPRDGRAWAILGRVDLELERYAEAATAFARAVETSPKVARDAGVWVDWAEAVGMAQGRTLAGAPAPLIARALELDPGYARALELAGSLAVEQGDAATAVRHWRQLLDSIDASDPRRAELARAIARAERLSMAGDMTKR